MSNFATEAGQLFQPELSSGHLLVLLYEYSRLKQSEDLCPMHLTMMTIITQPGQPVHRASRQYGQDPASTNA